MAEPLLTFDTIEPERPFIVIDQERYELSLSSDLGLVERHLLTRFSYKYAEAMTALQDSDEVDPELQAEIDHLVNRLMPILVRDCPREVWDKLTGGQRHDVVMTFLGGAGMMGHSLMRLLTGRLIMASLSQNSKGSTAAAPEPGSASRSDG